MATSHLEDEGTQDCGELVDTPSVTQDSPSLETSLTVSVDILVERVEPTPVEPSIEVMTRVVSEFLGDNRTQQMGEVPGDVSTFDEALRDTKVEQEDIPFVCQDEDSSLDESMGSYEDAFGQHEQSCGVDDSRPDLYSSVYGE